MNENIDEFLKPIIVGEYSEKFKREECLEIARYVLENEVQFVSQIQRKFKTTERVARNRIIAVCNRLHLDGVGVMSLQFGYKQFLENELERLK